MLLSCSWVVHRALRVHSFSCLRALLANARPSPMRCSRRTPAALPPGRCAASARSWASRSWGWGSTPSGATRTCPGCPRPGAPPRAAGLLLLLGFGGSQVGGCCLVPVRVRAPPLGPPSTSALHPRPRPHGRSHAIARGCTPCSCLPPRRLGLVPWPLFPPTPQLRHHARLHAHARHPGPRHDVPLLHRAGGRAGAAARGRAAPVRLCKCALAGGGRRLPDAPPLTTATQSPFTAATQSPFTTATQSPFTTATQSPSAGKPGA